MRLGAMRKARLALAAMLLLSGCKSVPSVAGAASGAATGAVTGNPGVAIAVGVAVQAVLDEVVKRWGRIRQGAEQDAIAATAGALPVAGNSVASATVSIRLAGVAAAAFAEVGSWGAPP